MINKTTTKLLELKPGDVFIKGIYEFVVLEHKKEGTLVLEKDSTFHKCIFDYRSSSWKESSLRKILNKTFAERNDDLFGKENIIEMKTDLKDNHGIIKSDIEGHCFDRARLLTLEEVKKYVKLHVFEFQEWLVTPYNILISEDKVCTTKMRKISSDHNYCDKIQNHFSPVFVLNSDIVVNFEEKNELQERYYDVLFSYLELDNWNEDGSPSDEDTHYLIGKIRSDDKDKILKTIKEDDLEYLAERCEEIQELFMRNEYVEDTLEVIKMLSEVGHFIK